MMVLDVIFAGGSMLRTLVLALAMGTWVSAEPPVLFGFSVQVDVPLSDLKTDLNGKVGAGGSFQVAIALGRGLTLRPRADVDAFPVSERARGGTDYRDRLDLGSWGIGVDFLVAPGGRRDHGFYGLGGLGVQHWVGIHSSLNTSGTHVWHRDDATHGRTSPWGALGLGFQCSRLVGLEIRCVGSTCDAQGTDEHGSRSAVVLQTATTFRW